MINRPWCYQCGYVVSNAVSAVLAKAALSALTTPQFMLLYTSVSVAITLVWVKIRSLADFFLRPQGIGLLATNLAAMYLFYAGLQGLDPSTHAFLSRAQIAFGFLLASLIFKEHFSLLHWSILPVCMLSIMATAWPDTGNIWPWHAVLATLLSAFLFALNFAQLKLLASKIKIASAIFSYNATLLMAMAYQLDGDTFPQMLNTPSALLYACGSAICASLSLVLYLRSVHLISFFESNVLRAAGPYVVMLIAFPFYPISITWISVSGALILTLALLALAWINSSQH